MGIFTIANQENIGRIPKECPASGGQLPRDGSAIGHRKPLPRRLHEKKESGKTWLVDKVEGCTHLVDMLAGVVLRHLQTTYDVLKMSLHQEQDFVQRTTSHIGEEFCPLDEALKKLLLLELFKRATVEVPS